MTRVAVYGTLRTVPCQVDLGRLLHLDGFEAVLPQFADPNVMQDQKAIDAQIVLNGHDALDELTGVPAVIVPGEAEAWHFADADAIPIHLRRRLTAPALDGGIYVRRDLTDYALYGRELAFALNVRVDKLAVCLPLKGLSALDDTSAPFFSVEMRMALFGNLTTHLREDIPLFEGHLHINSAAFASLCAETLLTLL